MGTQGGHETRGGPCREDHWSLGLVDPGRFWSIKSPFHHGPRGPGSGPSAHGTQGLLDPSPIGSEGGAMGLQQSPIKMCWPMHCQCIPGNVNSPKCYEKGRIKQIF